MPRGLFITLTMLVLGASMYFAYSEFARQRDQHQRYLTAVLQLERLLSDTYTPPDPSPRARQQLKLANCRDEWLEAPNGERARAKEIKGILTQHPDLIESLKLDPAAAAQFSLAMLRLRGFDTQYPELQRIDPEQLLRRAAAQGHGHATYYFARLLAEQYPHTASPTRPQDFAIFFDLNKKLEAAADAGSGGAAHLLGLRTQSDVLEKFAVTERDGQRRSATTSRTPPAWWCRSAELGYAPGIWQCYRVTQSRVSDAQRLLLAAADAGHEEASAVLAQFYGRGQLGLDEDLDKQKQFLCRAVALGNRPAINSLARLNRINMTTSRRSQNRHKAVQQVTGSNNHLPSRAQNIWRKATPTSQPGRQTSPASSHKESEINVKLVH